MNPTRDALQRVRDILTGVTEAVGDGSPKSIYLVGFEDAGTWVLLARGLCGSKISRTARLIPSPPCFSCKEGSGLNKSGL